MFLFTMFFSLLMLPFTLLRIAFGLLGFSSHILLLPVKFFARHTILCIGVFAILILYLALKKDPHAVDELKPKPAAERQAKNLPKGATPLIQPVTNVEDGDSAFATDTYALMSDQERAMYSRNFYTILSTVPDGQAKSWDFYNIQGSLRPIRTFKNNVDRVCRTFTETLKVHQYQQSISGTACDNGEHTWCKLKPNATPDCGLSRPSGAFDGLSNAVKGLF
jgi:surface antigen